MLGVLDYLCRRPDQAAGESAVEQAQDAFEQLKTSLRERSDGHRLLLEMAALALHNPRIAAAVRTFVAQDQAHIAELTTAVIAQQEKYSRESVEPIAAAIWSAIFGIATLSLIDPEFDPAAAIDALATLALT